MSENGGVLPPPPVSVSTVSVVQSNLSGSGAGLSTLT